MGRLQSRVQPSWADRHPLVLSRLDDGVIWDALLEQLPLSTTTNATEIRGRLGVVGLTLTRSSAATVQTSASTVVTSGIGVDDPRVGDAGYGRGLVVEPLAENAMWGSRDFSTAGTAWTAGTESYTAASGVVRPDGTADAPRQQAASGIYGRNQARGTFADGAYLTVSLWRRAPSGTTSHAWWASPTNGTGGSYHTNTATLSTTWERSIGIARMSTSGSSGRITIMSVDGRTTSFGTTAGARDVCLDFAQAEAGLYATEVIITAGAAATRQPDRVLLDSAARIVRGGRVGLNARMALKGSIGGSNDYSADPYLWRYDASNYASINRTTGVVTIVIAGASYTTASGFTASRGDVVDYWVEAGGGSLQSVVKARKSADGGTTWGAVTTLGTSGAPQGTHPSSGPLDMFSGAGSANHLSAWHQRFRAYGAGRRPAWAA